MVPYPPRIVKLRLGEQVNIVPLLPKNISRGDNIPVEEEWFVSFKNDDEPDTVQDEQAWANNNHRFAYNSLTIANALPYVEPSTLQDQRGGFASNIAYDETEIHHNAPIPTTSLQKGYKIPRKSLQISKINEMITDFNSSRSIPKTLIKRPSSDREKEHWGRKKKDKKRSSKPASQRHPESEMSSTETDNEATTSKVRP